MTFIRGLVLSAALALMASTAAAGSKGVVNVHDTDELIEALLVAQTRTKGTVIRVHAGVYNMLTAFEGAQGASGFPEIRTTVTLIGDGPTTTILQGGFVEVRHFSVVPGGQLHLQKLSLKEGHREARYASAGGGSINNFGGAVTLTNTLFERNTTGANPEVSVGLGGAVLNWGGYLEVNDSEFRHNQSEGGGAIFSHAPGRLVIRRSIFELNQAKPQRVFSGARAGGGAITITGAARIDNTTIRNNVAGWDEFKYGGWGGGLAIDGDNSVSIENSSIVGNEVLAFGVGEGGGLYIGTKARVTIRNSTIAKNYSPTYGGGIFNGGALKMFGVTLVHNTADVGHLDCEIIRPLIPICTGGGGIWNKYAGTIVMSHSVVALNAALPYNYSDPNDPPPNAWSIGPDCYSTGFGGNVRYSLIGDTTGCALGPQNHKAMRTVLLNEDPLLGDLVTSPVPGRSVIKPAGGSPLIDAGAPVGAPHSGCWPHDQIGAPRRDGDGDGEVRCDIGSVEGH